ncbi:hypothetical protein MTX78_01600 [Hymenobacter tibetensis]|uniref:Outer membrane protein beta-barrel domain-containing protein n=1 Tax=Hymenobacter tibetensis TaxID=497967 RepID=A0ABY4CYF6_9BACT|nr:hypothetical protein [Hymenobacter tibetensis]UOG75304.1 hypothetical protein MTX78_01600 [Hymenobacter tibetensis]
MMFPFPVFQRQLLLFALLAVGTASTASAQKYRTAAGLRFSSGLYGLTVQQKVLPKTTLEGLLLAGSREVTATVLAEQHFGLLGPSLNYYFGGGAHVGNHKDNGAFGGIDAIAGIEYKIALTRFVVSADFKPTIEFNAEDWARFATGISVRYILIKEKKTGLLDSLFNGDKSDNKRKRNPEKRRGLFD